VEASQRLVSLWLTLNFLDFLNLFYQEKRLAEKPEKIQSFSNNDSKKLKSQSPL